jgi:excinuclease ABC subunit A
VAEGTPEDVARMKESYTGAYLKGLLGRRAGAGRKREAAE